MFGCSVETRGANARLCAESALCLTAMDSLFASANYRSFFRHRVKESGYNRGRWRTWTAEMHRGVRVAHFQISPCITVQRPNHLERALFVTRTLHSAWGREGGREERRVCLPYLFHPFRAPTETSPMGTRPTSVLAPAVRPSVRVRSSRPFCVQLGASLEIMLRERPSQPRPTLNGQDEDRKIRKASSRNSLASKVQVIAAGTI